MSKTIRILGGLALCLGGAFLFSGCGEDPAPAAPPRPALGESARQEARADFASADPERIQVSLARIAAAEPPIEWLLAGLLDPDRGVREWSAHALGDIAPQDDRVVRALIVSLQDKDDYVRWKAVRALGNIGPRAKLALPLVRETVATSQEILRASGEKAIRQIEGR